LTWSGGSCAPTVRLPIGPLIAKVQFQYRTPVMIGMSGNFDFHGFYQALNSTREARSASWKQVAAEAGVGASTLARMSKNRRPDADGLAALSAWANLNPGDFVVNRPSRTRQEAEPLARISKLLREDHRLSKASAETLDRILRTAYTQLAKR
jgi:transcriptional regulator with XRE-family HTH domain